MENHMKNEPSLMRSRAITTIQKQTQVKTLAANLSNKAMSVFPVFPPSRESFHFFRKDKTKIRSYIKSKEIKNYQQLADHIRNIYFPTYSNADISINFMDHHNELKKMFQEAIAMIKTVVEKEVKPCGPPLQEDTPDRLESQRPTKKNRI
jgi:hypothetical protein